MSCEGVLQELTAKCEGLFYRGESDTDSQMIAFQSTNTVRGGFSPSSFLKSLGMQPLETSIEERDFETVTNNQISLEEDAEHWLVMKDCLETNLTDLRVFVIGETSVKIYITGLHEGYALGIFAEIVET